MSVNSHVAFDKVTTSSMFNMLIYSSLFSPYHASSPSVADYMLSGPWARIGLQPPLIQTMRIKKTLKTIQIPMTLYSKNLHRILMGLSIKSSSNCDIPKDSNFNCYSTITLTYALTCQNNKCHMKKVQEEILLQKTKLI